MTEIIANRPINNRFIKKNLEKFQKHHNKEEPEKDFKFKSKKKVGEDMAYDEID